MHGTVWIIVPSHECAYTFNIVRPDVVTGAKFCPFAPPPPLLWDFKSLYFHILGGRRIMKTDRLGVPSVIPNSLSPSPVLPKLGSIIKHTPYPGTVL